jgi:transcription-repair coupling factor (superfamily II helicase)
MDQVATLSNFLYHCPHLNSRWHKDLVADFYNFSHHYPTLMLTTFPPKDITYISGLEHSGVSFFLLRELQRTSNQLLVYIAPSFKAAEQLVADLATISPSSAVAFFEPWDTLPYELVSPHKEVTGRRIATLHALQSNSIDILVTTLDAALGKFLPTLTESHNAITLSLNQEIDREYLIAILVRFGYRRVQMVENQAEFSVKGSVIDIFPPSAGDPIRLEFFDNQIEKIKTFSAASQRSIAIQQCCTLFSCREYLHPSDSDEATWKQWMQQLKAVAREIELQPRDIAAILHAFRNDREIPAKELFSLAATSAAPSLLELLPQRAKVIVSNLESLEDRMETFLFAASTRQQEKVAAGMLAPPLEATYCGVENLLHMLTTRECIATESILPLECTAMRYTSSTLTELHSRGKQQRTTGTTLGFLEPYISRWRNKGYCIALVVGSSQRVERLKEALAQSTLNAEIIEDGLWTWMNHPHRYPVVIAHGALSQGTLLENEKVLIIAEQEIFPQRSYKKQSRHPSLKRLMSSIAELHEGDFVVHESYGIGCYQGLEHLTIEEVSGDFLKIQYLDSTIYLPAINILRMQRYIAAEGTEPKLDKLASMRWARAKAKVRESVVSLAGDLLQLYALRQSTPGWRYDEGGAEDERFAEEFPYTETEDQLSAINDVLNDMASERPMDRLICGDVGFGKTEVAMRAACKATQHARQVAVLVPTTILVEQHYRSFVNRFDGFPVTIGAVSRLHSAGHNRRMLQQLAEGSLDIIIGTHTLLGSSVQFKDLGLLIIDEEHRFGVKQKERLKQLRSQLDVLTMTATPIPRTLQLGLSQLRDMSVIATPPTDRRVIKTYVCNRNDATIKDAIERELQRGGQVYFLHNRISSIDVVAETLRQLVPEARVVSAHGQMNETQLERIMGEFVRHDADILVSTSIIESGLDIPNANTIIIDRADRFGLAQLYQMRGRVGRSTRQAFCYFLAPEIKHLKKDAALRLKVLQGLSELGQGFQVAIQDLEIRGAGNVLGKEQSGVVAQVGYEMYTRILNEAVLQLTDQALPLADSIDPDIQTNIDAYIPEPLIPDVTERLLMYQRLAALQSPDDAFVILDEISDRYGSVPAETENLVALMRVRALLRRWGVVRFEVGPQSNLLKFHPSAPLDPQKFLQLLSNEPKTYRSRQSLTLRIIDTTPWELADYYPKLDRLLQRLAHN